MSIKVSGLKETIAHLSKLERLDKPLNTAAKRTSEEVKTLVSDEIRKEIALKKGYVDERLSTYVRYARPDDMSAEITVSTPQRGVLWRNFTPIYSLNDKGVLRITIKPGQRKVMKGAFRLRLKDGSTTPVVRIGSTRYKDGEKQGLRNYSSGNYAMYGPSPSQVFNTIKPHIQDQANDLFQKNLDHNIKRYLDG